MNREILFRGKRVDNGEWVCGDLLQSKYSSGDYKTVCTASARRLGGLL